MYTRVLPRDLFNEAKLLKCLGRLSLLIHNGHTVCKAADMSLEMGNQYEGFIASQFEDGDLCVRNLDVFVGGQHCPHWTKYNSRDNYPLYIELPNGNHYRVFDEDGDFDKDFIVALAAL